MAILTPTELQALANKDYVRGNRFDVTLGGALSAGRNVTDHLTTANLAGVSYGTIDYRNASPVLKLPNDVIYSPLILTFNNASDGAALKHFRECNTTKVITDVVGDYAFNFFEDYTGDVIVRQYNNQNTKVEEIKYVNAWVHQISDINMSMENSNLIQTFEVSLLYEYPEYN